MKIRRITSIVIDLWIVSFIWIMIYLLMYYILHIEEGKIYNIFPDIIELILYICKDSLIKGESIGKRICGLKLFTINNQEPNILVKILRNLTIFIWPIEMILVLLFNKRLGDIIFNTKVVEKKDIKENQ